LLPPTCTGMSRSRRGGSGQVRRRGRRDLGDGRAGRGEARRGWGGYINGKSLIDPPNYKGWSSLPPEL
jgi:hypothetical protein